MSEQGEARIISVHGNWRRVFCAWWGHVNVITLDLLDLRPMTTCLRCYSYARTVGGRDDR